MTRLRRTAWFDPVFTGAMLAVYLASALLLWLLGELDRETLLVLTGLALIFGVFGNLATDSET